MSPESHRVGFVPPGGSGAEIRYLERVPESGEHVHSSLGEEWIITAVERDGGGYLARVVSPRVSASSVKARSAVAR